MGAKMDRLISVKGGMAGSSRRLGRMMLIMAFGAMVFAVSGCHRAQAHDAGAGKPVLQGNVLPD